MKALFFFLMLLLAHASAQAGRTASLFTSEEPLSIELKTDFTAIAAAAGIRNQNNKTYQATVTVNGTTFAAEVELRGAMRRVVCTELPPLKIILPKGDRPAPFEKMDRDLKLVTDCYVGTNAGPHKTTAMQREILQYRVLEAAGLDSFKVRQAQITYRNPDGSEYRTGQAFFIENIKDWLRRKDASNLPPTPADKMKARLVAGQTLVRNSDYFVPAPGLEDHNVRQALNRQGQPVAYVAYDFDLSEFVMFSEGFRDPKTTISALQTGTPEYLAELKNAYRHINENRPAVLAEIEGAPLPEDEKKMARDWTNNVLDAAKELVGF